VSGYRETLSYGGRVQGFKTYKKLKILVLIDSTPIISPHSAMETSGELTFLEDFRNLVDSYVEKTNITIQEIRTEVVAYL